MGAVFDNFDLNAPVVLAVHDAVSLPLALPLPVRVSLGLDVVVALAVRDADVEWDGDRDREAVREGVLVAVPVRLGDAD